MTLPKPTPPEHPSTQKVALMLNAIRNGKVTGSPREMAAAVISAVFEGEAERWDASEEIVEGGYLLENGVIESTTKHDTATHHRTVLVFYSDWEEGAPPVSRNALLKGMLADIKPGVYQGPPPGAAASAATHSGIRMDFPTFVDADAAAKVTRDLMRQALRNKA